jgi:propanediol dehydratase small subunit
MEPTDRIPSNLPADPRIAALWIVHGRACADLLRTHGRHRHAQNFEEAIAEITEIIAREVGRERLSEAMDWATENLWPNGSGQARSAVRN